MLITLAALALAFAPQEGVPVEEGPLVSTTWLQGQGPAKNIVVLFVGPRAEYDAGHIPGAVFTPADAMTVTGAGGLAAELPAADVLERNLESLGISDNSHVIVAYGRGSLPQAARTLFTLKAAGLHASMLDGGAAAWARDERPTDNSAYPVKPGSLSPLKLNAKIVDAAYVQSKLASQGYTVVDARAPNFYDGTQAGFQTQTAGHIKGAKSVPFNSLQKEDGSLKEAAEIAKLFADAGVKPGDEIIAYCHVGQQASVIMLGAEIAGAKAVLYDGSFQDWSAKNLPVEKK